MPDPEDPAKPADTQPAEAEDTRRGKEGAPAADDAPDRSLARELEDEGRAGKGINQAGYLKDKDAPGTGSGGQEG